MEKFQSDWEGGLVGSLFSLNAPGWSVWLAGFSGLSGSFYRMSGPTNQINQIDKMNQSSFDARSGRLIQAAR